MYNYSKVNKNSGSYLLLIKLDESRKITIGALGGIFFEAGFYIYVGRAKTNLSQRLGRHLSKNKKLHWHIDYLLQHARIESIFVTSSQEECQIAQCFQGSGDYFNIKGFGCSDCSCPSHLFQLKNCQNWISQNIKSQFSFSLFMENRQNID